MSKGRKNYSAEFKQDAVEYYYDSEKSIRGAASDLGINESSLRSWLKNAKSNDGLINHRGSGNFESEEAKEIARLKRELRNHKDAIEVLKKAINILND